MVSTLSSSWLSYILLAVGILIQIASVVADGNNPISHPAAGSTVQVGQPCLIQWSPGTPGPVFIKILAVAADGSENITASTPNNGSYTWTPDPFLAVYNDGSGYFLQICDINTGDCTYTFDGRFSFDNSTFIATMSSSSSTRTVSPTNATINVVPTNSSITSTTGTRTIGIEPTGTGTARTIPFSGPSSISSGAKIAIGVVISVVGTASLLVGGFFILGRRRKRQAGKDEKHEPPSDYIKPELSGDNIKPELPGDGIKPELSGDGVRNDTVERGVPDSGNAFELPANEPISELPNTERVPIYELGTESERTK